MYHVKQRVSSTSFFFIYKYFVDKIGPMGRIHDYKSPPGLSVPGTVQGRCSNVGPLPLFVVCS